MIYAGESSLGGFANYNFGHANASDMNDTQVVEGI